MPSRVEKVRLKMEEKGLECLLVTGIENVRYLSGFSGSNGVIAVTGDSEYLVTDGRYREQASRETGLETIIYTGRLTDTVAGLVPDKAKTGFETNCAYSFYRDMGSVLGVRELVPVEGLVERLRSFKDDSEVELIREAILRARKGFTASLGMMNAGVKERDLAAEIDYHTVLAGADGMSFDTVVASGPNSSLPHAGVTDRKVTAGDIVVVDFGARYRGYCSDTTRTLAMSESGGTGLGIIEAVSGAVRAAISAIEPGVPAAEVDSAARGHLEKHGLADYFIHSLGHGVGLEVHELPSISSRSSDTLEPGMVFTIEPGVYKPGEYGVRIEEMVLLTDSGPELLTSSIPHPDL